MYLVFFFFDKNNFVRLGFKKKKSFEAINNLFKQSCKKNVYFYCYYFNLVYWLMLICIDKLFNFTFSRILKTNSEIYLELITKVCYFWRQA